MPISSEKKETIKVSSLMVAASVFGKAISVPSNFIVAGLLGPSLLGNIAIINLIVQWSGYTQLGFLTGLWRNVPLAYGRGDPEEARRLSDVTFSIYTILSGLTVVIFLAVFAMRPRFVGFMDWRLASLVGAIIFVGKANSFLRTYVTAEGKFMVLARLEFIAQLVVPSIILGLVLAYGFNGWVVALLLSHLLPGVLCYVWLGRPRFRFKLDFPKIRELMSVGSVLYVNNVMEGLFMSIGTIVTASMMSPDAVGLYAFAAVVAAGSNVPFSDGFVIIMRRKMLVEVGQFGSETKTHFRKYLEKYYVLYSLMMSFFIGNLIILYFHVVNWYLPKFKESLVVLLVLFAGYMVYGSRVILLNYLNATSQLSKRSAALVAGLLVNATLSYTFVSMGYGILGVAAACSVSFVVISVGLIFTVYGQVIGQPRYTWMFLARLFLVSAILTTILVLFYYWTVVGVDVAGGWVPQVRAAIETILRGIAFSTACLGVHLILFPKFGVWDELKDVAGHMVGRLFPSGASPAAITEEE